MERIVDRLLQQMVALKASDMFLSTGNYPAMRIDGDVRFISDQKVQREMTHQIYEEMTGMNPEESFLKKTDMDLAYNSSNCGRFRVNIFYQNSELAFVFRHIPAKIPCMEDLGLPVQVLHKLASLKRGLVLVTGVTGSGKSTTLAAIINYLNDNMPRHIVTVEDPIEFVYERKLSLINQRELGRDTPDFSTALKSAMRQSPDVILIGEMRDSETVEAALQAAETGHLVLSTLHTLNAIQSVERILAFFPPHQHNLIRLQMALILEGVISQRLIRRSDKRGRIPCIEILLGTPTVKELLEQGKTRSLDKALAEGGHFGCQTFNQSLLRLTEENLISQEQALRYADNPDQLKMLFRGISQSKQATSMQPTVRRERRQRSGEGQTVSGSGSYPQPGEGRLRSPSGNYPQPSDSRPRSPSGAYPQMGNPSLRPPSGSYPLPGSLPNNASFPSQMKRPLKGSNDDDVIFE